MIERKEGLIGRSFLIRGKTGDNTTLLAIGSVIETDAEGTSIFEISHFIMQPANSELLPESAEFFDLTEKSELHEESN